MEKIFFDIDNGVTIYAALKSANPPVEVAKIFNTFHKQIDKYYDFEVKYFEKVQKFAENDCLVNFLCDILKNVYPYYGTNQNYKYILLVLASSTQPRAVEYLQNVTEFAIANQIGLCRILKLICDEVKAAHLSPFREKLDEHFTKLYQQTDYFEFVKRVGIDISKVEFKKTGREGSFYFELTNMEGIKNHFELKNESDKANFCNLQVSVFTPAGERNCFHISLSSERFSLYHYHKDFASSDKEEMILYNKETQQEFHIENSTKLLKLKDIIRQIESVLQTKFVSEIAYSYFPRPLKGRKELQKWWENEDFE